MELNLPQGHPAFGRDAALRPKRAAFLPHSVARSATFPASCAECRWIRCEMETVFELRPRLGLGVTLGKVDEWLWIFQRIGSFSPRSYYWLRWLFCFLSARILIARRIPALLWAMQSHAAKTHLCTQQRPENNQRAQSRGPNLWGALC